MGTQIIEKLPVVLFSLSDEKLQILKAVKVLRLKHVVNIYFTKKGNSLFVVKSNLFLWADFFFLKCLDEIVNNLNDKTGRYYFINN